MENEELNIKLQLGKFPMSLRINWKHEKLYRDAAAEINDSFTRYAEANPNKSAEEIWVIVALDIGVNYQNALNKKATSEINEKLENLNKMIETELNK